VQRQIEHAHSDLTVELVTIRTSGDRFVDRPLSEIGGKGLFVKEIEEALLAGSIDCAVHSLKDLPAELAPGMIIAAVPRREDPRDFVLTRQAGGLDALPAGAIAGTSSLRRTALLRAAHPGLRIVALRGNVDTRLRKLEEGEVDALVLAGAGLRRLGITHPHAVPCDPTDFIPAIGQGSLALESRADEVAERLRAIEDPDSRCASEAERALLVTVAGSIEDESLILRALIAQPDGRRVIRGHEVGSTHDAVRIGRSLGERLLAEGGAEILRTLEAR
jgi:hydroxymethylbilane synthase